jgi:hypothetical protein
LHDQGELLGLAVENNKEERKGIIRYLAVRALI